MSLALEKLKAKFGKGYQTDAEKNNAFVLADDRVRFDHNGAGGAVRVEGYRGIWPLFGKPSERLGGPDLIAFKDAKQVDQQTPQIAIDDGEGPLGDAILASDGRKEVTNAAAAGGPKASGSKLTHDNLLDEKGWRADGIHFVKRPQWMCRPRSGCKPCDRSELFKPYCQPYGNRILIECRRIEATKTPDRKPLGELSSFPPSQKTNDKVDDGAKGAAAQNDVKLPPVQNVDGEKGTFVNPLKPGEDVRITPPVINDDGAKGAFVEPIKPVEDVGIGPPLVNDDGAKGAFVEPVEPIQDAGIESPILNDGGAKGAFGDQPIQPAPVPAIDEMGALNLRSIDELVQFGDVFLEPRSDVLNADFVNVELVPRDEMFVSGHVYKGYQICGRDRAREARDYAEFLGVNLILALIAIYILLNRQRFLAGQHRSMLARRIGRS